MNAPRRPAPDPLREGPLPEVTLEWLRGELGQPDRDTLDYAYAARALLATLDRDRAELRGALDAAATWLESEAEFPRPDPRSAMRLQAQAARAALREGETKLRPTPKPEPRTRLIRASADLSAMFGTRTEDGRRLTAEWGEPIGHCPDSDEYIYAPTLTAHDIAPRVALPVGALKRVQKILDRHAWAIEEGNTEEAAAEIIRIFDRGAPKAALRAGTTPR